MTVCGDWGEIITVLVSGKFLLLRRRVEFRDSPPPKKKHWLIIALLVLLILISSQHISDSPPQSRLQYALQTGGCRVCFAVGLRVEPAPLLHHVKYSLPAGDRAAM